MQRRQLLQFAAASAATLAAAAIECIGPALLAEASAPHVGFWKV